MPWPRRTAGCAASGSTGRWPGPEPSRATACASAGSCSTTRTKRARRDRGGQGGVLVHHQRQRGDRRVGHSQVLCRGGDAARGRPPRSHGDQRGHRRGPARPGVGRGPAPRRGDAPGRVRGGAEPAHAGLRPGTGRRRAHRRPGAAGPARLHGPPAVPARPLHTHPPAGAGRGAGGQRERRHRRRRDPLRRQRPHGRAGGPPDQRRPARPAHRPAGPAHRRPPHRRPGVAHRGDRGGRPHPGAPRGRGGQRPRQRGHGVQAGRGQDCRVVGRAGRHRPGRPRERAGGSRVRPDRCGDRRGASQPAPARPQAVDRLRGGLDGDRRGGRGRQAGAAGAGRVFAARGRHRGQGRLRGRRRGRDRRTGRRGVRQGPVPPRRRRAAGGGRAAHVRAARGRRPRGGPPRRPRGPALSENRRVTDTAASSQDQATAPPAARRPSVALVFAGAALAGGLVRWWQVTGNTTLVWNDTADFLASSRAPWWSQELWVGLRPPLVPVVLQAIGGNLRLFIAFQCVVAALCWAALAAAVWAVVGGRRGPYVAAGLILAFSLTVPVVMWDQSALSESLAVSLLALTVAAGLQMAARPSSGAVIHLLLVTALWLTVRDSPAIVVLLGGAVLVGVLAVRYGRARHRGGPGPALRTPVAALAVGALVLGLAATAASTHGQRHVYPLRNVLEVRVLPYPERVRWFADHGMPQAGEFVGDGAHQPVEEAGRAPVTYIPDGDPDLGPWFAWLAEHGRATFARWVATHPWYVLDEPLRAPERTFNNAAGDRGFYASPQQHRVPLVDRLLAHRTGVVGAVGLLAVGYAIGRRRITPALVTGAVTASLAVPHGLLAWHLDGMETARHLVVPMLQFHLGVLLVVIGLMPAAVRSGHG